MSFLNKKRKYSTFLKYKNGKVISLKNEFKVKDLNIEEEKEITDIHNLQNQEVDNLNKEDKYKNRKSKIFIFIGVGIIISSFILFGMKYCSDYIGKLSEYMTIEQEQSSEQEQSTESTIEKTEINTNNNSNKLTISEPNNTKNNDSLENINTTFIKTLIDFNNVINSNVTNYYKGLKSDIITFKDGKSSASTTISRLKTKRELTFKNYQLFLITESMFKTADKEDIYICLRDRYANYINAIDDINKNLNQTNAIEKFNAALNIDNELFGKQQSLIIKYLDEKNIKYVISDNQITLN